MQHSCLTFRYTMICLLRTINSKRVANLLRQSWRYMSVLDTSPSSVVRNAEVQTIYTETLNVLSQGRLHVKCPFNLHVTPVDQKDFPRLDKAFFTIYGDSAFKFSKEDWNKLFTFSTSYNPEVRNIHVVGQFTELGKQKLRDQAHTLEVSCQIPPHYELDVICTDDNIVSAEFLQCPEVHIQTRRGDCLLKNIVADSIVVHSLAGNIKCFGSLHAPVDLSTGGEGGIQASKLQGSYARLAVENADIHIRRLHSEHFRLKGQSGRILLGHLHGNGSVNIRSGSINITSIDGDVDLQCDQGNVKVFFTVTDRSKIRAKQGDVEIGLVDTASVQLDFVGKRVQVSEDAEHFHRQTVKKDGIVYVKGFIADQAATSKIDVEASKGTVELIVRDWFSTLKLDRHLDP